ncbi:ParA family protein [Arthrobacter roseus]
MGSKDSAARKMPAFAMLGSVLSTQIRRIQPEVFADPSNTGIVSRETSPSIDVNPGPSKDVGSQGDDSQSKVLDVMESMDESTPLARELASENKRREKLLGRKLPKPQETRVLTVSNQKGGVGKTTTTVNLAAALASAGLNVLVIDIDPQGNASTALGIEHHAEVESIYEVLIDDVPLSQVVAQCPDIGRLICAPATIHLAGAEIELVSLVAREQRLSRAIDLYEKERAEKGEERLDYVLIDCPPSLGLLTVNAFVAAREVLIPIQCEYYALEGLSQLLKNIEMIQKHLNADLVVSTILLTMYDGRTNLASQVASEVREHFPKQVLQAVVPRSVRISEAPSYQQTVMTYDPSSSGALSYLEAAAEIAERGA